MSGTWSKMKNTLLRKTSGASASPSSQLPPRAPNQSVAPRSPSSTTSAASSTTSLSSRLSRSLSSGVRSSQKSCAICLGNVRSGQGQAIFTAECSHTFHFSCIAKSVKHGNHICPICRSKWKDIPFQLPALNADDEDIGRARVSPNSFRQPNPSSPEPVCYSDDESIVAPVISTEPSSCAPSVNVSVKALPEFPAVAAAESVSDFAVLVGVRAPTVLDNTRQVERAPIDLVTVLDVSGSMNGSKLFLLKRAVCFVIENMGPTDRLSIVSFSVTARRIFPLRRMTDQGREDAKSAVNSLYADGRTDIVEGLKKGKRVLEERREKNPVASVILLSDGRDTSSTPHVWDYLNETRRPSFPVHTFGFGGDHDAAVMHAISDASGGTFSFIESVGAVQDSFARCIGGLLSVVARDLCLTITTSTSTSPSKSPGLKIGSISSGRYANEISEVGIRSVISVGDLYADEDKDFLVHLSLPVWPIPDERTPLLNIACSYKDAASEDTVELEIVRVEILRPNVVSPTNSTASIAVDRQRNRFWVVEGIAEAKEMAETGNLEGAKALLTQRRSALVSSASAQAGDGLCSWLEAELMEIEERMETIQTYENSGRAYMLSGLSSHSWQRATTRGDSANNTQTSNSGSSSIGYNTPSMVNMVTRSQDLTAMYQRDQRLI